MPHNLIKDKLTEIIEQTCNRECPLYLACNEKGIFFFTPEQPKRFKLCSCQKVCDALHYFLDNIFLRFVSKLYRQIVGIPMVLIVILLLQICFCFVINDKCFVALPHGAVGWSAVFDCEMSRSYSLTFGLVNNEWHSFI